MKSEDPLPGLLHRLCIGTLCNTLTSIQGKHSALGRLIQSSGFILAGYHNPASQPGQ